MATITGHFRLFLIGSLLIQVEVSLPFLYSDASSLGMPDPELRRLGESCR